MSEIKVTQIRSTIGRSPKHRRTVRALGLTRIGSRKVHRNTPEIRGMIEQVRYLLRVEE
jgi:large subunit ribosomal protein L30